MKKILFYILIILIACGLSKGNATAQNKTPINVYLTTDKSIYLLNEPINTEVQVRNESGGEIITPAVFIDSKFFFLLTFTDQDGHVITSKHLGSISGSYSEPSMPDVVLLNGSLIQVEKIERLPSTWTKIFDPFDAYLYYPLKPGKYSLEANVNTRIIAPENLITIGEDEYEQLNLAAGDWAGKLWSDKIYLCIKGDLDGDGFYYPACQTGDKEDCDDNNPAVNPGIIETGDLLNNGKDDDCNPATVDQGGTPVLTMPNGGEFLTSGGIWGICWKVPYNAEAFDLKYSLDNGTNWNFIKNVRGVECSNWGIPVVTGNKKQCLVKVIGYDLNGVQIGEDISDNPFTINVLRVLSPNGGENIKSGSTLTITWQTYKTTNPVAVTELGYKTATTNWKIFRRLAGNPGTLSVKLPYLTAPKKVGIAVRLKDASGNILGTDMSDAAFTIQP